MQSLVLAKKQENCWISYIKQRIRKNKNFLGFISGETGSGKSWSSLSVAEQADGRFTIEQCVFGAEELMLLINSKKLRKGSVIVFEEVGVEMSNKNWQSITNKVVNYLLQTFRHRNFILIMNSPFMDFVDATTRKLFHAEMRTVGINRTDKTCMLKPLLLQYNSKKKKFYYKRLRVITQGGTRPVDSWSVPKPSPHLIEMYELKKRNYTDELNKRILSELQAVSNPKGKKEREHKHNWLVRITKNERYCRTCGYIEALSAQNMVTNPLN